MITILCDYWVRSPKPAPVFERIDEMMKVAKELKYKNPDPRCIYPFPSDYCWSYACYVDGNKGFENIEAKCLSCKYWKAKKP